MSQAIQLNPSGNGAINISVNTGKQNGLTQKLSGEEKKSISLANQNKNDGLAARQNIAKKQAMKIVGDAFDGDKKIDAQLQEIRDKNKVLSSDRGEKQKIIASCEQDITDMKKAYGVSDDSQEQKDLELLQKEILSHQDLTRSDMDRLKEIKEGGLTEYQTAAVDKTRTIGHQKDEIRIIDSQIAGNNMAISSAKIERLKSSPMLKAQKEAEQIMDEASKDAISQMYADATEHIEDEQEEKFIEAKEQAEKKEEQEEKLEEIREKREEATRHTENSGNDMKDLTIIIEEQDYMSSKNDVKSEIDEVLDKLKLLSEDIKGIEVDKNV